MSLSVLLLLAQAVVPGEARLPVLEFPEAGLDDPAAYDGYATRFFRDSEGNAFQVYLDGRDGRVVDLWADAANASAAFTVRDERGRSVEMDWDQPGAEAFASDGDRGMRYRLRTGSDAVDLGWFLLGTMRQERDFQYWGWHRRPYGQGRFVLEELAGLVESVGTLPLPERRRHLALLHADDVEALRARLTPRVSLHREGDRWVARIEHVRLDARSRMTLEFRGDTLRSTARLNGDVLSVRSRAGGTVTLEVVVTTDEEALEPLGRDEIFNSAFTTYYERKRAAADSLGRTLSSAQQRADPTIQAFRRLQRGVRGLGLLASRNKLMAALPNYATYFGRDMMMSALMLEPIVSVELQEYVITNALKKLSPAGDVSHEEAVGGQAIREAAAEYTGLVREWHDLAGRDSAQAAGRLARARAVLGDLAAVRENYRMIDDDFQLPVILGRYLTRSDVPAARKRRFLTESLPDGASRLDNIVRNLSLVAERTRPYAEEPEPTHLVGFLFRDDEGWLSGSWRDSRAGYGNGRFAMDVNAVWAPKALEATADILAVIDTLRLPIADLVSRAGGDGLARYLSDRELLRRAITTWRGARRHFEVTLDADQLRERMERGLNDLPSAERTYWQGRLGEDVAGRPLRFLAVSLDEQGEPVAVANTDPATDLFLEDYTGQILRGEAEPADVEQLIDVMARPYPVGLFVAGLGPLVANDLYAPAPVRRRFREDLYHSPRVVWGREVNLLLLGLIRQIDAAYDPSGRLRRDTRTMRTYVETLRTALDTVTGAVEASGMRHNELWSYRIEGDTLRPMRYGTSSDIQLWNLTELAVRFQMDGLPSR